LTQSTESTLRERAALVVAHPGHELRVHAWLERARPRISILTDGSGHGERGRLLTSAGIVERVGARKSRLFGAVTDREAYRLILDADLAAVRRLAAELADELAGDEVDLVVSDAVEGFNPVHDLCAILADAAAAVAGRRLGRAVERYDFPLEAEPAEGAERSAGARWISLGDEEWRRKLDAARGYQELRHEVERGLAAHGAAAFRVEVLRPVAGHGSLAERVGPVPYYESFGERRVAEGVYDRVLRFHQHFAPLAEALGRWAESA
jgi:hypothetical protein